MAKNTSVIVPYEAESECGKIVSAANTGYDGSGTVVDFLNTAKTRRVFAIHLQARGTNVATLIRLHLVSPVGAISPFCKDIKVPATTASSTEPLWSRTLFFHGRVIPPSYFLRAQSVIAIAAGIAITPYMQVLET